MRREEIAHQLEELARGVRAGEIEVKGESLPVPEELDGGLKSKRKNGALRVRIEMEWDEARKSKAKKGSKKKGKASGVTVKDYDHHVLLCCGGDCKKKGARERGKELKSELKSRGLGRRVRVDRVDCMGYCKQGPNAVVYPGGTWYLGLEEGDAAEIAEDHLERGNPVERLAARRR